jgi:ABC-type bacteriocin/lantibiotic exporter with double-glycine peptidase domain
MPSEKQENKRNKAPDARREKPFAPEEENPSGAGGSLDRDSATQNSPDLALHCLVAASRILGLPADYKLLTRAFPQNEYPQLRLPRAAKGLNLKAKKTTGNARRLKGMPLPAFVFMKDESVTFLIKSTPEKLLIYELLADATEVDK